MPTRKVHSNSTPVIKQSKTFISIMCTQEMARQAAVLAANLGVSRSQLVRDALQDYMVRKATDKDQA